MKNQTYIAPLSLKEAGIFTTLWLAYFAIVWLAVKVTTVATGEMAIWPADAITLAFMMGPTRGRPVLTLLVSRSASAVLALCLSFDFLPAFLVNCGSIASIGMIYVASKKMIDQEKIYNSKNLIIFFLLSCIGSTFSAIIGTLSLISFSNINFLDVLGSWFASTWIGYVTIVPLILIIFSKIDHHSKVKTELLRTFSAFLIYNSGVYLIDFQSQLPLLFMIPMGLMALAYVTNLSVVACSILITAVLTILATVSGHGAIATTPATPSEHLLMLQAFLAIITASMLPMAALMSEHRRLQESLVTARLEAEAASQAKSQFLATISHEIRTPLNGVLGMAQIMGMGDLDDTQTERLKVIRRSGEVLLSILNDVLDLSKIEAGKLTIESVEFDLEDLLRTTLHCYSPLAKEKGIAFKQTLESVNGLYEGDPTRIRQIAANLLSNALKFTGAGEIQVLASHSDGALRLTVQDTGIGIPPEQLNKLFAKFTQAESTTTRRFGGTGLGLAICRDLATLMDGKIEVESEMGRGSAFTALIPLTRIGDLEMQISDHQKSDYGFGTGVKVLAAEDNPTNQLVLRTLLEMAGFTVVMVENGKQAIASWEQEDWHIILMDVQMPVMDGPDATRAIRSRESATGRARTPIIALTANTMSHQVQDYLASGMDGHIGKPIDAEALFRTIIDSVGIAAESSSTPSATRAA